jgi:hypothetical protein
MRKGLLYGTSTSLKEKSHGKNDGELPNTRPVTPVSLGPRTGGGQSAYSYTYYAA